MDANPAQYYTHPVHRLATSQGFVAQPQQPLPSQSLSSSTHGLAIPLTTENNGTTPTKLQRSNAVLVEEANGTKRKTKADEFRLEIEERTRNGESCEQISAALNARGIQVTDKSISRWRIAWGFRKRALRKSKPLKPEHLRLNNGIRQQRRKAEITRMSEQNLTPEEIATIMTGRGMSLKDGAKSILRLQTVWKLREIDLTTRQRNARHNAQRQAKNQQEKEFVQYARELGLDNPSEWVKHKMNEPQILEKRKAQTIKLIEELDPELRSVVHGPGRGKRSSGGSKTAPIAPPSGRKDSGHGDASDASTDASPQSPDASLQAATRRTLRSTNRTAVPACQPTFADNEDSDADDSDFEPETAPAAVVQNRPSNAAGRLGVTIDPESSDDSGSNFHFDPGQSPDAQSFPQGIDHDDDTGSEDDGSDEDAEPMEVDASGRPAQPSEGPTPATYAHVETRFAPQLPQEIDALNSMISPATACSNAALAARAIFEARLAQTPTATSLTGMPPSASEVEAARWKLKDAARLILETL